MTRHLETNPDATLRAQWRHEGYTCRYGVVNRLNYVGYVKTGDPELDRDDLARRGVTVHGGMTYTDRDGWVGFDTLHGFDACVDSDGVPLPGLVPEVPSINELTLEYRSEDEIGDHIRVWGPDDVRAEVERLAEELAAHGIPRPDSELEDDGEGEGEGEGGGEGET